MDLINGIDLEYLGNQSPSAVDPCTLARRLFRAYIQHCRDPPRNSALISASKGLF